MAEAMTPSGGPYPVQVDVAVPERVERWRPLVLWLLVIPHIVVLYVYGIALFFVLIIAWFAALFTGHLPDSLERFLTGYLRYQWRVTAYLYGLSTVYPSFSLPSGDADPGGDAAVTMFRRDERLSRVRVFFRYFMVLPHIGPLRHQHRCQRGGAHRLVRGALHRPVADGDARVLRRLPPLVPAGVRLLLHDHRRLPPVLVDLVLSPGNVPIGNVPKRALR